MPSARLHGVYNCAAAVAIALLSGCQTYEYRGLDPAAHEAQWAARDASNDDVRAFAARLAAASGVDQTPFNPDDGVSVEEGQIIALVYNPDLRIARLRAGVAKATADHAGLWDDPQISIDVLRITESTPDPWIVGSAISLTIPISGRLEAEKARAAAAMHAELDRVAEAEWAVRHDLRKAWLAWSAQRLRLEQTEQIVRSLDAIVDSTAKLVEAGELLKTEAALFTIEHAERRADLGRLQGEAAAQEQEIRALLGLSPRAAVRLVESLASEPADPPVDEPARTNLSLTRLRSEYEVAEQSLLREVRKQYPDLTIGPQYESDEGQSRIGLVGAIPLPILNANKGGIAEAKAEREVAQAAFETEYERVIGRLAALRARLEAVKAHRAVMDQTLIPLVDRQMADARQLVELGEGGSLVLLESLVRAHDAKLTLIDIQLEAALTNSEIRFLLGPAKPQPSPENNEVTP